MCRPYTPKTSASIFHIPLVHPLAHTFLLIKITRNNYVDTGSYGKSRNYMAVKIKAAIAKKKKSNILVVVATVLVIIIGARVLGSAQQWLGLGFEVKMNKNTFFFFFLLFSVMFTLSLILTTAAHYIKLWLF